MGENNIPNLSRFRDKCCYCYKSLETGIEICQCDLSFCKEHGDIHYLKNNCEEKYSVSRENGELKIKHTNFSEEDLVKLKKRIELIVQCQDNDESFILKDEEIECPHISEIESKEIINLKSMKELKCGECELQNRIWVCYTCGYIGCGRVQYGVEGNGHAKLHHIQTNHPVFVFIPSIKEDYSCEAYCYLCDSYIKNIQACNRIKCTDFKEEKNEKKIKLPNDKKQESVYSPYLGFKNAGNTCYISSVMQLLGFAVSKSDFDLETHFQVCWRDNPLDCFSCQLMRVIKAIKDAHKTFAIKEVSIADFIRLIWRDMPTFTRYKQQDAHEFLLFLIEKIKELENSEIPPITSVFDFTIEKEIYCGECGETIINRDKMSMLYTQIKKNISDSVRSFFNEEGWKCKCGGKKDIKLRITELPKFLIVQVGRYSYKDGKLVKISDKIIADQLDLTEYLKKVNKEIEKSLSKEYEKEKVKMALIKAGDDEEVAKKLLESFDSRHNPVYDVIGCIKHSGENAQSGHYTWWVLEDNECFLVDDSKVLSSDVSVLKEAYILLFH